jgi:hypothetical protein
MAEERLDRLAAMFTEIDRPTLSAVLEAHSGNLQAAASYLLDGALSRSPSVWLPHPTL